MDLHTFSSACPAAPPISMCCSVPLLRMLTSCDFGAACIAEERHAEGQPRRERHARRSEDEHGELAPGAPAPVAAASSRDALGRKRFALRRKRVLLGCHGSQSRVCQQSPSSPSTAASRSAHRSPTQRPSPLSHGPRGCPPLRRRVEAMLSLWVHARQLAPVGEGKQQHLPSTDELLAFAFAARLCERHRPRPRMRARASPSCESKIGHDSCALVRSSSRSLRPSLSGRYATRQTAACTGKARDT